MTAAEAEYKAKQPWTMLILLSQGDIIGYGNVNESTTDSQDYTNIMAQNLTYLNTPFTLPVPQHHCKAPLGYLNCCYSGSHVTFPFMTSPLKDPTVSFCL